MLRAPLLTIVLLPAALTGQDEAQHRRDRALLTKIGSGEPKAIAAGAVAVGDAGLTKAIPALRKALRDTHEMDQNAGWYPTLAILDALVRLEADVPTDEIEHFARGRALPAVTILAARNPKKHERILLHIFDVHATHKTKHEWQVAAICLTKLKSKRFAERVVSGLRLNVSVDLILPGDEREQLSWFGYGGGFTGSSARPFPMRGYPAFGLYVLNGNRRQGQKPLAQLGKTSIYHHRRLPTKRGINLPRSWSHLDFTEKRLEYAAALLGTTVDKLPVRQRSHEKVFYHGTAKYERDLARIQKAAKATVAALVSRFRAAGLVDPKKPIEPSVTVQVDVSDERGKGADLPDLDGVTVHRSKRSKK